MSDAQAIARLEADLERDGASAERLFELAGLKLARSDFSGAIEAYEHCRVLEPNSPGLYNNLGTALGKAGRSSEAIAAFEHSVRLDPRYVRPQVNLGKLLFETGRAGEAVERLQESLRLQPDYVPALVNLGNALVALNQQPLARATFKRAIRLDPQTAEARVGLADALLRAGEPEAAIRELRRALAHSPGHVESHWHLGHLLFLTGRWQAAWPHLEYRLERLEFRLPSLGRRWNGDPGCELRLVGEQGLGDQIQFARYASVLAGAGAAVTLECDPRLVRLFTQANLGVDIQGSSSALVSAEVATLPLMSAPAWHRTDSGNVPCAAGYLCADPARIECWHSRLPAASGLTVALAWAGNPQFEIGRNIGRSPPLQALAPLARLEHVRFVSLQKGYELNGSSHPWIQALPDLDAGPDAFLDTAAVLRRVDLLITSDTGIAHLAGALGVPTWLCLMRVPDWRWGLAGERTPWYDSMRLFRQQRQGDWDGVYAEVAAELADVHSAELLGRRALSSSERR